ncbi:acetylxylan esterase [Kribbella pittospori]|uniref:Acetylxylan esterase n=1 Tax=Kribbella pittospori TaxID=722689 RepID=A0A4R0K164_9ACTN|nr:acetylxylan esterase [Kribbella pittospori]TCC51466.1 acetylxylan esterase [Kribbella pittospori]
MAMFDLPLDKLREYRPEVAAPADLVDFWRRSLEKARTDDLSATFTEVDNKLAVIDTYDVTYAGFGGAPIKGWLHVPARATGPLPTVVQYFGYSGGRGFPHATNLWAQAGYAHFVMDTRGQGYSAGGGSGTADDSPYAGLNHAPGFMTAGIGDPETYYYHRVFVDAVRGLEAARTSEFVDPDRIAVTGGSQGGGIAIAAAGLAGLAGIELLGCAPDVPFLCHFERALQITGRDPYGEITRYLKGFRDQVETAYRTLSYFDGVNLGRLATAPTLFSVALMDSVCPPSTVFAAYNAYGTASAREPAKEIQIYSHNEHEGGQTYQQAAQLDWFASILQTRD